MPAERNHVFEIHHDVRKRWLKLSPDLVSALTELAEAQGDTLESLLVDLINEGLAHRLRRR